MRLVVTALFSLALFACKAEEQAPPPSAPAAAPAPAPAAPAPAAAPSGGAAQPTAVAEPAAAPGGAAGAEEHCCTGEVNAEIAPDAGTQPATTPES